MTYVKSPQLRSVVAALFFTLFAFSGQLFGQTAIGTCPTTPVDSMYAVEVSGFSPGIPYTVIINGTVELDSATQTGTLTSSSNFDYVDGTDSVLVQIVDFTIPGPGDTTDIVVHEVFCLDIDDDGSYDFNGVVCDYITEGIDDRGTIISTAAPYTGTNLYVYVLTNEMDTAIAYNHTGYFTDLEDGTYDVYAFTFLNQADADDMIDDITLGVTEMKSLWRLTLIYVMVFVVPVADTLLNVSLLLWLLMWMIKRYVWMEMLTLM